MDLPALSAPESGTRFTKSTDSISACTRFGKSCSNIQGVNFSLAELTSSNHQQRYGTGEITSPGNLTATI